MFKTMLIGSEKMQIAVCDDDKIHLNKIHKAISKCSEKSEVKTFTSGISLLNEHTTRHFNVVFLDIDMPEFTGFEIADKINSIGNTLIVFVTSHDELVYSSIKFQPFRFIRKAHLDDELPEVVEALTEAYKKQVLSGKFRFQTNKGDVFADLKEVLYIEIYGHWLQVHMSHSEPLECYGNLSALEEQLSEFDFVRTHKSYLVNCQYIYSVQAKQIILDDKTEIPLSRYKAEDVKNRYKKYIRSVL